MGTSVEIETLDHKDRFTAYAAEPEGSPKAAIVVVQEIFGVNPGIREKVDQWAAKGYYAVAPDLFWRMKPGIQLDPDQPAEFTEALGYMQRFDIDAAIRDLEATIRHARRIAGKVGVVGFCLGGKIAYLAATRTDTDASVSYYGVGIDALLGEAHAIARPLLLHFAELDHFVDAAARETITSGLAGNRHVEIEVHPGVDHGFATSRGARRVEEAAQRADARTEAFFAQHLG
jgi:carboxymethylenebutenolidase